MLLDVLKDTTENEGGLSDHFPSLQSTTSLAIIFRERLAREVETRVGLLLGRQR